MKSRHVQLLKLMPDMRGSCLDCGRGVQYQVISNFCTSSSCGRRVDPEDEGPMLRLLELWKATGKTSPEDGHFLDRGDERLYHLLQLLVRRLAVVEAELESVRGNVTGLKHNVQQLERGMTPER